MTDFLSRILEARADAVRQAKEQLGLELTERLQRQSAPRDFRRALSGPGISVIAELKRASPSRGPIAEHMHAYEYGRACEAGGASALSVLTEPDFFNGSHDDLQEVHNATSLPTLLKDFVIDPYQVMQARAFGADAVLVIVRIVDEPMLAELIEATRRWEMTPMVEVFDEDEVQRALRAGADVIGVNHRDLQTFEEDPARTRRLRPAIPPSVTVVALSSIHERGQVEELEQIGVDAVLVGEALMTADQPGLKVQELLGR